MTTKQEVLNWLKQLPDSSGECDRCHKEPTALYSLPMELETEPEAQWMYCPDCFRKLINALM